MSALKRTSAAGREAFNKQHAGDWLVWEAAWKAPRAKTLVLGSLADPALAVAPKGAEALAIALPAQLKVTVGRSHDVDLELNDGTLSGYHLNLFLTTEGQWLIEDAGSTNGTRLNGLPLKAGLRMPVHDGAVITAGQVPLTFQTAEGLWQRLVS